jgi:hypothetical protein
MKAFHLRPSWRVRYTSNQQKVTRERAPHPKDVKNEGRSHDVYENKRSHDKMSDEKADIFGNRHGTDGQKCTSERQLAMECDPHHSRDDGQVRAGANPRGEEKLQSFTPRQSGVQTR